MYIIVTASVYLNSLIRLEVSVPQNPLWSPLISRLAFRKLFFKSWFTRTHAMVLVHGWSELTIIQLSRLISKDVSAGNGSENCCQQYWHNIHSIVVKIVKTWNFLNCRPWFSNNLEKKTKKSWNEINWAESGKNELRVTQIQLLPSWKHKIHVCLNALYYEQCRIHWIAVLLPKENQWGCHIVRQE